MSTYVIGDVQGCYYSLRRLLEAINFDPAADTVWFAGDLVNRGSHSLAVLRFVKSLGDKQRTVLGNHDFYLLIRALLPKGSKSTLDTLQDVLIADDSAELIEWLTQQHLIYHDTQLNYTMVHAGLAPQWTLATALSVAQEVETLLRSPKRQLLLANLYGNMPNYWDENLRGWPRIRAIVNYCTRMRYCYDDASLVLDHNNAKEHNRDAILPWFLYPERRNANDRILFGHWSALKGITNTPNVYALDTACVWGGQLTAMRLEDQHRIAVACAQDDVLINAKCT